MSTELKTMTALVRREMWEHRAFWLVPAVIASFCTFMMVFMGFKALGRTAKFDIDHVNAEFAERMDLASFAARTDIAAMGFTAASGLFAVVMAFVLFFYLLDSLYADRRDRSVLFWRSMPVTDRETVLSKLATATLAGPLATLVVLFAAYAVWSGVLALFGVAVGFDYWWIGLNPVAWIKATLLLLGAHIGMMLVVAPFIGWVLLASAWAPRAPFLWAFLPPLGLALLEEMFLDTNRFLHTIGRHFEVLVPKIFSEEGMREVGMRGDGYKVNLGPAFDLSTAYLAEPRLWIGIALGALFVTGAIWMRRYRDDAAY